MSEIPTAAGSYGLVMRVDKTSALQIGRLGRVEFPAGVYVYLGSAMGPGGLRARLAHHLRCASAPHWHIDWLRLSAAVVGIWWARGESQARLECEWAQRLLGGGGSVVQPGFGSSDCRQGCPAHLLFFGKMDGLSDGRRCVEEILTGLSGPVFDRGADPGGRPVYEVAGAGEYRPG